MSIDTNSLHPKAREALSANLSPGEPVLVVICGPSAQAVIGTDRRAFVYKKGFMAGAAFGAELTSWDYRNVVGVQIHTGMMSGAVVLQAPGQSGVKTNYWGNKDDDPYKAPNAIPIVRPFDDAKAGVARLRQAIEAAHTALRPAAAAPAVPAVPSVAQEIAQLADLHAQGAIDAHEFTALKAGVLARLNAA